MSQRYYVPPTLQTAVDGERASGEIVYSAPYYSSYGPGAKKLFISPSPRFVAQSGDVDAVPSYPYSCSTYVYSLLDRLYPTSGVSRPIDPPFRSGLLLREAPQPTGIIGTHFGRAATSKWYKWPLLGFWTAHVLPTGGVTYQRAYSARYPWENGYVWDYSFDPMTATAFIVRNNQDWSVIIMSPFYYVDTPADWRGEPVSKAAYSLVDARLMI